MCFICLNYICRPACAQLLEQSEMVPLLCLLVEKYAANAPPRNQVLQQPVQTESTCAGGDATSVGEIPSATPSAASTSCGKST